jgi:hypothetical protein
MTDMIDLSNAILETWPELRPAFEGMTAAQIVGVTRELLAAPTKDYAASPPENPAPGERAVARAAGWFPLRAREFRAAPARTWAASSLVPLHLGPLRLRGRPVPPARPGDGRGHLPTDWLRSRPTATSLSPVAGSRSRLPPFRSGA